MNEKVKQGLLIKDVCMFAGPKQQKPAQHFIHIVQKSLCYCGIYT